MTSGAVGTFRFENVWDPEQALKLYPSVIAVTVSSGETVKAIGTPWDVMPLHWPTLRDGAADDGVVGPPQALARAHTTVTRDQAARLENHAAAAPRVLPSSVGICRLSGFCGEAACIDV